MNIDVKHSVFTNETIVTLAFKSFDIESLSEAVQLAKKEIALRFWEEHQDKIMAQMNLSGLANLIAIHASEALKK